MLKMQDNELNIEDLSNVIVGFIKKNIFFLLAFVGLGLIIGFFQYKSAEQSNLSNVYAKSSFVPLELIKNEISSLNALLEERDLEQLSQHFNIELEQLQSLNSIKYFEISNTDKLCSFQIKSSGENNINDAILNGITLYLENNAYLKNYLKSEKEILLQNDQIYKDELANLLKIQAALLDKDVKKNFAILTNPSELSMSIIELQKSIKYNELLLQEVVVYKIIDVVSISSDPSLLKNLFTHTVVIVFLGCFFLLTFRLFLRKS